jgi:hypothetical protein
MFPDLLCDAEALRASAEPLDFSRVHLKGLVKAHGNPSKPGPGVSWRQFFHANDEPMNDAGFLVGIGNEQMKSDLVLEKDLVAAHEKHRTGFAQIVYERGALFAVRPLERRHRAGEMAVAAAAIR